MAQQVIAVGALSSEHLGSQVTLSNGEERHTDTLVAVSHSAQGTEIETEQHWHGTWVSTEECTIETTEGGCA